MNALQAWLARWFGQPDKVLHVAVGFALATVCMVWMSDLAAIGAVGLVGWGKERWDKANADVHTPDGWDAFATVAGAWLGLFVGALVAG